MNDFTLHELHCLDAVATTGSFHAAAEKLNRSHPAIYAAIKSLESRLDLQLFDRSGYRVKLTDAGMNFHRHAKEVLEESRRLSEYSACLQKGEETDLTIIIGDLCPTSRVIGLLKRFFNACPQTRLHLHFDTLGGPQERLLNHEADLIIHHIDSKNLQFETIDLFTIDLYPVVAPGFLPFPIDENITPKQLRSVVQCIIRDTAKESVSNINIIEGAHSWTVGDQLTKKELIVLGMGWGHLPKHLVEDEMTKGQLLSIAGSHIKNIQRDIVAARLQDRPVGPVAKKLWEFLKEPMY